MFDKELVIDSLQKIKAMLELIIERASVLYNPHASTVLFVTILF